MRIFEVQGSGIARDIEIILQTLDSVIPDGQGSYLASPISTGYRYYKALAAHEATNLAELIAILGEEEYLRTVRWPNVEEGELLANRLRLAGVSYLINTGPIFIQGWLGRNY